MRAFPRPYLLLILAGMSAAVVALASGFKVSSMQARANGSALLLAGNLDLTVTPQVEEAIATGIPIELAVDVRLYRERALIWDEKVASWTLRRELRYHALTGQYLIVAGTRAPVARESLNSLGEALGHMGTLSDVTLPLRRPLAPDAEYRVEIRAGIDKEALPPLLRPVAYTSPAWDLNSGWTSWKVQL